MRILAIDSSSMVATVAVVTDGVLTAEYTINHKKTTFADFIAYDR